MSLYLLLVCFDRDTADKVENHTEAEEWYEDFYIEARMVDQNGFDIDMNRRLCRTEFTCKKDCIFSGESLEYFCVVDQHTIRSYFYLRPAGACYLD